MKTPLPEGKFRIFVLVGFALVLLALIVGTIYATLWGSNIIEYIKKVDAKPPVTVIEKELQPVHTVIAGEKGEKGEDGKDSVSTHTIVEKETTIIEQVPIKGDKGDDGAKIVLQLLDGVLMFKYEGDREWLPVEVVGDSPWTP